MPETTTPFWEQEQPDDDPGTSGSPAGPPAWEGPGIDPATGTWRPVKRGDPFMVGDHEFRWSEGPMVEAIVSNDDGHELGRVHVPFDPETQQPPDDMIEEARRFFLGLEHMRGIITPEGIADVESTLHRPSAGPSGGESLSSLMIEGAATALQGLIKITVTDDDDEGLTTEQLDALGAEGARLFDSRLPDMVREIAGTPDENGLTFWQRLAREIIATAMLHAHDDLAEGVGGLEAVPALNDDEADAFEEQVFDAYRTGPYLAGAMLSLTRDWTEQLAFLVSAVMENVFADSEGETSKKLSRDLLRKARESLGLPPPPDDDEDAPPIRAIPAFDGDGYGRTDNSIVSIGARRALSAGQSRWNLDAEAWPVFTHENGSGKALYSPSRLHFPTAHDATRAVGSYSPAHVAMLKYITAQHLVNNARETTGPYGGFYLSVEEFLEFRGIKKHSAGGYRPEDRREVVELVEALECIEVTGSVERYEQAKGKRGRKETLTIRSPLIVVSHRVTQSTMLGGAERPIAWYLRAGDWAVELERYGLQYAVTTKALLQLHTQNDMHAFNLGNHLTEQYRIRASQKSWQQPHRVGALLDGAEVEVDRKNPGRFRKRIEAALDVLASQHDMQGTPIIEHWEYAQTVEPKGRGWLDRWLDSGIIITPPAELIQSYSNIGRRRRPKQLAS